MTAFRNDVTDLILLVGTNPLPALITARYFMKKNNKLSKIWFIYSIETKVYEESLIAAIESNKDMKLSFEHISVKERDAKNIREEMKKIKSESKSIFHLNYTCGTKSMVVHSYRALEQFLGDNISFSYLDPETFTLRDDEGFQTEDLRDEIKVSFEEMIKLHRYTETDSDKLKIAEIKDKVIKVFKEFIDKENIHEVFYSKDDGKDGGYSRKLFENRKSDLAKKRSDLNPSKLIFKNEQNQDVYFEPNESFKKVLLALGDYSIFDESWKFRSELSDDKVKFFTKFIDGDWLEYYIYGEMKKIVSDEKELTLSSEVFKNSNKQDLEIDLTYVRGYQLFGISCTTSNITSISKSKGFEVIQRTKQLGGDESKSILVTTMGSAKATKLEISLLGNKKGTFIVLGLEDLKPERLQKKIKKFILNQ